MCMPGGPIVAGLERVCVMANVSHMKRIATAGDFVSSDFKYASLENLE